MLVRLLTFILYFLKKCIPGLKTLTFSIFILYTQNTLMIMKIFSLILSSKIENEMENCCFYLHQTTTKISIKKQQNHKCFNVVLTYILLKNITVIHSTTLYHSHTPKKYSLLLTLLLPFLYLNKSVYNQNKNKNNNKQPSQNESKFIQCL